MRRLLCLTPLAVLLLPSAAPASEAPSRAGLAVKVAPEVMKLLTRRLRAYVLDESEGQTAEVRLFAALPDGRLVVATRRMDVQTDHWRSNRFGTVWLTSHVPCECFYAIDASRIVCSYNAASKTLTVRWPGVDILTITPEMSEQRKEVKTTGMRFKAMNNGVLRELEGEVPEGVRRVSRHEFGNTVPAVEEETRSALRELFEDLVRPIDPSIRVYVEPAP
jgi:hypothetical protein